MRTVNKKQQGFSMIEVLVSLIVIGVGMLGLSGLQIASMKGTNNAHSRNIAAMLAMDLGDRMRANPLGVSGGFYAENVNCTKDEKQCRGSTFCSPKEAARFDLQEVKCGVDKGDVKEGGALNLLPNGRLLLSCDKGCNELNEPHNVTFRWNMTKFHHNQTHDDQDQAITIPIIP